MLIYVYRRRHNSGIAQRNTPFADRHCIIIRKEMDKLH
jgi:hypothetical protein